MDFANKQITFHQPTQVSQCLNEGLRAVAELHEGSITKATDHCVERVSGLTDAKLTSMRGKSPPKYTRDGASFLTLIWVLWVDGIQVYRSGEASRDWLVTLIDATDLFESPLSPDVLNELIAIFQQSIRYNAGMNTPTDDVIASALSSLWTVTGDGDNGERLLPVHNRIFVGREHDVDKLRTRLGVPDKATRQPLTFIKWIN